MAVATTNEPLKHEIGDYTEYPVAESETIYEGVAVGDNGSGYARGLEAGDAFLGHCVSEADNSSGSTGAIDVRVLCGRYKLQVTLASVAITDKGKNVYMSEDSTYTLTEGSNSIIGIVHRYVSSDTCVIECHCLSSDVVNHEHTGATDGGALTSPHITTSLEDANGKTWLGQTAISSAVEYVHVINAASGGDPSITVAGTGTNINLELAGKGSGGVLLGDDESLIFGTDSDATILYDETTDNKLEITCSNGISLSGALTADSTLAVTGIATFTAEPVLNGGIQVADDEAITLGDGDDATILYDETTDDKLEITCANGITITGNTTISGTFDAGTSCEADAYSVGGSAGVDFSGSVSTMTTVKGIVTAAA